MDIECFVPISLFLTFPNFGLTLAVDMLVWLDVGPVQNDLAWRIIPSLQEMSVKVLLLVLNS